MDVKMLNELEVSKQNEGVLAAQNNVPMGFEDEDEGDMIIPRVKVIQTLSPERKEKLASEGDVINSLTKDKLNGKTFVPVFKFNSNILWKDRAEGGGIACQARDGKTGYESSGTCKLCKACRLNEFDNTKTGKDAIPKCTKYINFFGFISGERLPIILSFAKTNYNEGKKMYSLAKVTMQNMWNHGYSLNEKLVSKNGNEWYIFQVAATGATSTEDREYGAQLYKAFRASDFKFDVEDNESSTANQGGGATEEELANSEF
jgi:hypothetical protein